MSYRATGQSQLGEDNKASTFPSRWPTQSIGVHAKKHPHESSVVVSSMISPYQVANEEHAWSKCRQCHLIMSTDTLCTYMLPANIESVLVCKSAREAHFEQANEYVLVGQPASDRCILVLYSCGRTKGLLAQCASCTSSFV